MRPLLVAGLLALATSGCQKRMATEAVVSGPLAATTAAEPAAPGVEKAAGIGQPVTLGDVRVTLLSVKAGDVLLDLEKGNTMKVDDLAMTARLKIENVSQTKVLKYHTWRNTDLGPRGKWLDEHGNDYFGYLGERQKPVGAEAKYELYPGESTVDVVAAKPPVAAATHFKLELPHPGLGQKGEVFRFQFARGDLAK